MPNSLIVRIIAPTAAILSLVGQPALARVSMCWNADELPAAQLYAFHTALMVGALKCRSERPDVLNSYNAFAQARKSSLDAARTVLQAHFIRELGPETGLTEFKNFDTEIANRVSMARPEGLPCDGIDVYSRLAASASQADLYTLAGLNNSGVEIRSCGMEPGLTLTAPGLKTTRRDEEPAAPVLVAKADVSPEAPQAAQGSVPAVAYEQQGGVAQPETKAPDVGSGPQPQEAVVRTAAANEEVARVDPAKALDDAARALAAAAVSLRTASSDR